MRRGRYHGAPRCPTPDLRIRAHPQEQHDAHGDDAPARRERRRGDHRQVAQAGRRPRRRFEPIVEVITDKVNAEVPSPFEGVLTQILVAEGQTVPNDADIAVIERRRGGWRTGPARGGDRSSGRRCRCTRPRPRRPRRHPRRRHRFRRSLCRRAAGVGGPRAGVYGAFVPSEGRMTPAVRRLAREHGVDLRVVGHRHRWPHHPRGRRSAPSRRLRPEPQPRRSHPPHRPPSARRRPPAADRRRRRPPPRPPPPPAEGDSSSSSRRCARPSRPR